MNSKTLKTLIRLVIGSTFAFSLGARAEIEIEFTSYKFVLETLKVSDQAVLCAWGDTAYDVSKRYNIALVELAKTLKVNSSGLTLSRLPLATKAYENHLCGVVAKK